MGSIKSLFFSALALATIVSTSAFANPTTPPPSKGATPFTTVVMNDEKEALLSDLFSRTLYVFDLDNGTVTSACNGGCAETWPPYIITPDEAKSLAAPLGSVARSNKTLQLTYEGKPVYTYAYDRAPGDDHGDGIGGVWHYVEIE